MILKTIVIIGGGAAGLLAAGTAAQNKACCVVLMEKNQILGKKLLITGKGRCNVTNACEEEAFFKNMIHGGKFLYSSYRQFKNTDVMRLMEELGVPLKTERGNRVFPVSDRSADIVGALKRFCKESGVEILSACAEAIRKENGRVVGVSYDKGKYLPCDHVILCTGGCTYPLTGSTGDGYAFAKKLGHTVTPLQPSLVPMEVGGKSCGQLMGLSLRNVAVRLVDHLTQKTIYQDFGELLFTHFGLSGPLILSASCHMEDKTTPNRYAVSIDLKPALSEKQLDLRLQRDFSENLNKEFSNVLDALLPKTLIPIMVEKSKIPPNTKVHSITKEQRLSLLRLLKDFRFDILRLRPMEEAIVTSGGVETKEVNPKTMESKLVKGLYFAGELLDLDGYTGGFNLQIAFTTGYAAGYAASQID